MSKQSSISIYVDEVVRTFSKGNATEHSYRSALERLFNSLSPDVSALNEPKRVKCGAPDFIIQRGDLVIGHVEAKDLHLDLRKMKDANRDQQQRYLKALPNLIYTNCLDWDFYRNGELKASVTIADWVMGIQPKPEQFAILEGLLKDFIAQKPQTITSPKSLAQMLAGKAVLIKDVMANALREDKAVNTELTGQFQAFKEHLIHDITPDEFADLYAETIAYGMFAARLHDDTPNTFTRTEALELLPKSNPFLRSLFGYLAGPDLDGRIRWIIDDLADVFQATDMAAIMADFGRLTGRNDPFLHFYETFLAAYNPTKRKARGVWYTPEAVVNFIVRAVDEVLQTEFGLSDGLADTSKVTIDWDTGQTEKGKPVIHKKQVHRVQILDPATGTGTFLAEVIKQIAPRVKGVAEGMWSRYIETDLIPRLHGFELLMASYAMCHMKLDMVLTELGYKPTGEPPRLSVYLTNSLEEGEAANQQLPFAQWLSREVKEANTIKRDMPIMCVIGNPPYSVSSSNKGEWIKGLLADYKKDLKERNIQPLSDDYIKFIRLGHHLINKNGEGILAVITNNSYLDGIIHRQMRKSLLNDFDTIYITDLHGSSKKNETAPDGSKDVNVFDIMQGVSIAIMVRKAGKKPKGHQARVFHRDLWGARKAKYHSLYEDAPLTTGYQPLTPVIPYYFFTKKDFTHQGAYEAGFKLDEFMPFNSSGITTHRDHFVLDMNKDVLEKRIRRFFDLSISDNAIQKEMELKDKGNMSISEVRTTNKFDPHCVTLCAYRPFDVRHIYYSSAMIDRDRSAVMRHFLAGNNLGICLNRQIETKRIFTDIFVTNSVFDRHGLSLKESNHFAPLYLYPSENDLDQTRRVNFDPTIHAAIAKAAGLVPSPLFSPSPLVGEGGSRSETDEGFYKTSDPSSGLSGHLLPQGEKERQSAKLLDYARSMRKEPTEAEKKLWHVLRARRFSGFKFRRQVPMGSYIADFVCHDSRLVVEADGSQHGDNNYDARRDEWFKSQGYQVSRFWNHDILNKTQMVEDTIWRDLHQAKEHPSSSLSGHLLPQGEKERQEEKETPQELLIFDYIYGLLHSPHYRTTYAQFLKIDFPRIPYPSSPENFAHFSQKGNQLRRLHLMEADAIGTTPFPFKGEGTGIVEYVLFADNRVYINKDQYFENVSQIAWEFHIGGYQPAQKWLKDRKGRTLTFEDVIHYQKIIKILDETDRMMKDIDDVQL